MKLRPFTTPEQKFELVSANLNKTDSELLSLMREKRMYSPKTVDVDILMSIQKIRTVIKSRAFYEGKA